ncbi:hypothetical protein D3C85_1386960 [compost metagenome]
MEMSMISPNRAGDSSCCRLPAFSTAALAAMQVCVCSSKAGAWVCSSASRLATEKQNIPEFHRKLPLST